LQFMIRNIKSFCDPMIFGKVGKNCSVEKVGKVAVLKRWSFSSNRIEHASFLEKNTFHF
jgi:hypothetical protein